jgi:hypothetical protein
MGDVLGKEFWDKIDRRIKAMPPKMRSSVAYAEAQKIVKMYPQFLAVPLSDTYEFGRDGTPRGDAGYHWVGKNFVGRCSKRAPGMHAQASEWLICPEKTDFTVGVPLTAAEIKHLYKKPPNCPRAYPRIIMVRQN